MTNPKYINMRTSIFRSDRFLEKQSTTMLQLSSTSAYSNKFINASFDISVEMLLAICRYRLPFHSIESKLTIDWSGEVKEKVIRIGSLVSSSKLDPLIRGNFFPTSLLTFPAKRDEAFAVLWGASGAPQRPLAQVNIEVT